MIAKGGKIIGTFQIRTVASLLASPNVNFFYIQFNLFFPFTCVLSLYSFTFIPFKTFWVTFSIKDFYKVV